MPVPLTTDNVRLKFAVKNPSRATSLERVFKVKDVYYEVEGPDGQRYDWDHTGQVTVPVAGFFYDQIRKFPTSGLHQGRPVVIKLNDEVRTLGAKSFTIASATTTREFRDDGSVWDITTFSDSRAAVQTMVAGPLDIEFGEETFL